MIEQISIKPPITNKASVQNQPVKLSKEKELTFKDALAESLTEKKSASITGDSTKDDKKTGETVENVLTNQIVLPFVLNASEYFVVNDDISVAGTEITLKSETNLLEGLVSVQNADHLIPQKSTNITLVSNNKVAAEDSVMNTSLNTTQSSLPIKENIPVKGSLNESNVTLAKQATAHEVNKQNIINNQTSKDSGSEPNLQINVPTLTSKNHESIEMKLNTKDYSHDLLTTEKEQNQDKNQLTPYIAKETLPLNYKETTVVKISDFASRLDTPLTKQISERILYKVENGTSEFNMKLYPKELGEVSVKLVSEKGFVTVEILAANPKTQNLLLSSSNELKDILSNTLNSKTEIQILTNQNQTNDYLNSKNEDQANKRQYQGNHQQNAEQKEDEHHSESFFAFMQQRAYQV